MYVRISHAGGLSTRTNISNDTLLYVQTISNAVSLFDIYNHADETELYMTLSTCVVGFVVYVMASKRKFKIMKQFW